jgi:hypothetical protein
LLHGGPSLLVLLLGDPSLLVLLLGNPSLLVLLLGVSLADASALLVLLLGVSSLLVLLLSVTSADVPAMQLLHSTPVTTDASFVVAPTEDTASKLYPGVCSLSFYVSLLCASRLSFGSVRLRGL